MKFIQEGMMQEAINLVDDRTKRTNQTLQDFSTTITRVMSDYFTSPKYCRWFCYNEDSPTVYSTWHVRGVAGEGEFLTTCWKLRNVVFLPNLFITASRNMESPKATVAPMHAAGSFVTTMSTGFGLN